MSVLLAELTRDRVQAVAPDSIAVLPTASIEQHGAHLPIITDTLLCGTVAERAAERAVGLEGSMPVYVAPVLTYGCSHHHRPFAGVLSLTSSNYMAAVTDVLEGLALSGFKKLVVLNGHGGNTDPNSVLGLDFVNRLGHKVSVVTAAYWDIARPTIVEHGIMPGNQIAGHAGRFETAMVMAVRPELINQEGLAQIEAVSETSQGLNVALAGGTVQTHGTWAASTGYTDNPGDATPEDGAAMLEICVNQVAEFLVAFLGQL